MKHIIKIVPLLLFLLSFTNAQNKIPNIVPQPQKFEFTNENFSLENSNIGLIKINNFRKKGQQLFYFNHH